MLTLTEPVWLFLLPLPWLIYRYSPKAQTSPGVALKVPFFKKLSDEKKVRRPNSHWRKNLLLAIWFCLLLAASNPQWLGNPVALTRSARNVLLAIDISGSMQIPDMQWQGRNIDRLTAVKRIAEQFIARRQGDRMGLIVFGSKAYLQTPLTFDHETVADMLGDASIGLAGPRTALGEAIGLAIKRLIHFPEKNRVLILLTDGANNAGIVDPIEAANVAKKYHLKIYAIGIGSEKMLVTNPLGAQQVLNPSQDLDQKTLASLAKITGGLAFRAKDTAGLKNIYEQIHRLEPVKVDKAFFRPHRALYFWPLGLACCLALVLAWRYLGFQLKNYQDIFA